MCKREGGKEREEGMAEAEETFKIPDCLPSIYKTSESQITEIAQWLDLGGGPGAGIATGISNDETLLVGPTFSL